MLRSMTAYTGRFRVEGDKFITTVDGAWNEVFKCENCGARLIPLSYVLSPDEDPRGNERPALKCTGCSQKYRWEVNPGWVVVTESK